MDNSRSITNYLKRTKDGVYVNIDFLDKLKPNTFDLTKNGRIQSTPFGSNSNIVISLNSLKDRKYNKVEHPLHPDRLNLLAKKILNGRLNDFIKQNNKMPEFKGYVNKKIYTSKVADTQYECSLLNIYYREEDQMFVVDIKIGVGDLVKDETNRNDFQNFKKKNNIGILIPYEEMELMASQIIDFIENYRLTMTPAMFQGRFDYECKCKTIFKSCIGDSKKIREIQLEFNKLSEEEKQQKLKMK